MKLNPNKNFCVIIMHAYRTIRKLNSNVNLKYENIKMSKISPPTVLQVVCMHACIFGSSYVRFSYRQFLCMLVCDIA